MLELLRERVSLGHLRHLDHQMAKFVLEYTNLPDQPLLTILTAIVSHEQGLGHVCIDLSTLTERPVLGLSVDEAQAQIWSHLPLASDWLGILKEQPCVSLGEKPTPLVLMGSRLYLHRAWAMEHSIATDLAGRAIALPVGLGIDTLLNALFARSTSALWLSLQSGGGNSSDWQKTVCDVWDVVLPELVDWSQVNSIVASAQSPEGLNALQTVIPLSACFNAQKVAAAMALTRQFSVISGGPGTGKTTTVTKLLAALVSQAQPQELVIKLVAPTGKAAARLTESIGLALTHLPLADSIKSAIPTEASTLHRLLGAKPNSVSFQYHKTNPLHLDVLVVDEASMVDLTMMFNLLSALPPHARVILLGDRDQLASVEAGAILGDIGQFAQQGYSFEFAQQLTALTGYSLSGNSSLDYQGLSDSVCVLNKSYRFHAQSGIGTLAKKINRGFSKDVLPVFSHGFSDLTYREWQNSETYDDLLMLMVSLYRPYLTALTDVSVPAKTVLNLFSEARLLCAIREGQFGVEGINQNIFSALKKARLLQGNLDDTWYEGRPVMITRNDANLGLYNGDVGIVLERQLADDPKPRLRVFFEQPDGNIKAVLPSRLPQHETAFAMTIHKSQGSEFASTVMVLPPKSSPLLTRELVYTGVTRAKKHLYLFASERVLSWAIKTKTERQSGLVLQLTEQLSKK